MASTLISDWTRTPRGQIHVRKNLEPPQSADAPHVILVHGMVVSGLYMEPTAELLAGSCHVYVPDLPGYGLSYKPRPALLLHQLAEALALWMDKEGLSRASLVGNSFRCQIIAEFAVRYPERVDRLVLQGPTIDPAARTAKGQIARMLLDSLREPLKLAPIMLRDYWLAGTRRSLKTLEVMLQDPIEETLPKVQAPTMVVRGAKDPVVPRRWAREATRLLPRGELREIPGGTHTLNYVSPLEFTRVIRPFLNA